MDRDLAVEAVPAVAAAAAGVMAVARELMAPTMAPDPMALHMVLLTALRMGLLMALRC